jgi:TonB-like protein
MPLRSISTLLIAALSILSIGLPEDCAAQARQSQAAFETAIRDNSTSPYVVLFTVVDDRTGQTRIGCTTANLLRGAIYLEKWGSFDSKVASETISRHKEAETFALENTSHVFHFSSQAALNNILPFRYPEACAAIERGSRARIGDRGGQLLLGPFVEGPSVNLSSCPPPAYRPDVKAGIEAGTFVSPTISLLVGPEGTLKEGKVSGNSGSEHLDAAVRAALSACKFSPRTIDGVPVPEATWTTFTIGSRTVWFRG